MNLVISSHSHETSAPFLKFSNYKFLQTHKLISTLCYTNGQISVLNLLKAVNFFIELRQYRLFTNEVQLYPTNRIRTNPLLGKIQNLKNINISLATPLFFRNMKRFNSRKLSKFLKQTFPNHFYFQNHKSFIWDLKTLQTIHYLQPLGIAPNIKHASVKTLQKKITTDKLKYNFKDILDSTIVRSQWNNTNSAQSLKIFLFINYFYQQYNSCTRPIIEFLSESDTTFEQQYQPSDQPYLYTNNRKKISYTYSLSHLSIWIQFRKFFKEHLHTQIYQKKYIPQNALQLKNNLTSKFSIEKINKTKAKYVNFFIDKLPSVNPSTCENFSPSLSNQELFTTPKHFLNYESPFVILPHTLRNTKNQFYKKNKTHFSWFLPTITTKPTTQTNSQSQKIHIQNFISKLKTKNDYSIHYTYAPNRLSYRFRYKLFITKLFKKSSLRRFAWTFKPRKLVSPLLKRFSKWTLPHWLKRQIRHKKTISFLNIKQKKNTKYKKYYKYYVNFNKKTALTAHLITLNSTNTENIEASLAITNVQKHKILKKMLINGIQTFNFHIKRNFVNRVTEMSSTNNTAALENYMYLKATALYNILPTLTQNYYTFLKSIISKKNKNSIVKLEYQKRWRMKLKSLKFSKKTPLNFNLPFEKSTNFLVNNEIKANQTLRKLNMKFNFTTLKQNRIQNSNLMKRVYVSLNPLLGLKQSKNSILNLFTDLSTHITKQNLTLVDLTIPALYPRLAYNPLESQTETELEEGFEILKPKYSSYFVSSPFSFIQLLNVSSTEISDVVTSQTEYSLQSFYNYTIFTDANQVKAAIFRRFNKQKTLFQNRQHLHELHKHVNTGYDTKTLSLYKFNAKHHLPHSLTNSVYYKNNIVQNLHTNSTLRGSNWGTYFNTVPKPRTLVRIPRIKFKPGYGRIWRTARQTVQEFLGISIRYQYRLTPKIQKQYYLQRKILQDTTLFNLGTLILSTKLAPDHWFMDELLKSESVFLNGLSCQNKHTKLFVNDFIQCFINIKFYIVLRWLESWSTLKRQRANKIFYQKFSTTGKNKTAKLRKNLPLWFFDIQYFYSDIPKFVEVDYFTLSIFVLFTPTNFECWIPSTPTTFNWNILNMYNWKYIT